MILLFTEISKGHLETKKQILEIRRRYGEDKWLSSQAGTFVQDIMGIQPPTYSITSEFTIENLNAKDIVHRIEDSVNLLMKDTHIELNDKSESLKQEINEFNDEKNRSKVLTEEENISEVLLNNDTSVLENLSEPPYDPEQGIL